MSLLNPTSGRFIDLLELNSKSFGTLSALSLKFSENDLDYSTLNWEQYFHLVQVVSLHLIKSLPIEYNGERCVIGFLSNSSTEYIFYSLAFMNINIVPLHLSTRIGNASRLALLEKANACALICSQEFYNEGLSIQSNASYPLELLKLEKLDYLSMINTVLKFDDHYYLHKFASKSNQTDELAYYVHSTGSTSLHPKLIPISNSTLLAQTSRPLTDTPTYPKVESCLPLLPLFHTGGQLFLLARPIRWAQHVIAPPSFSNRVMSGEIVLDMLKCIDFDYVVWLPKLLVELIDHCDSIPKANGWEILAKWGGLSQVGGATFPSEYKFKFLNKGMKLQNVFGSSEIGIFGYGNILSDSNQPQALFISNELKCYWDPYDIGDEIFELIIKREELGLFKRDEDYRTKDLFKIIEWKPRVICEFESRRDDVLVHITGEKTNPIPMESKLNECKLIKRSVILGKNHTHNHVIIQLDWNAVKVIGAKNVKQVVYNQVKLVNSECPTHSRLESSCIHITSKSEEIATSVKGNVLRQVNLAKFNHLINDFQFDLPPSPSEHISTIERVKEIVTDTLHLPRLIGWEDDFFEMGLDSLSGLVIVKKLQIWYPNVPLNVSHIYKFKNSRNLANYLDQKVIIEDESIQSIQNRVDSLISKYTSRLDVYKPVNTKPNPSNRVVLVVGCNASLACHYIHALLNRKDVYKVIGLMRGKSFEDKTDYQTSTMLEKGLVLNQKALAKLHCFNANMLEHNFNLPEQIIQDLLTNVTEVIQVGWRMNFLSPLEDFEDCIETTSNLLEFCLFDSKAPKNFQFVSTIAPTLPTYREEYNGIIPETLTPAQITNLKGCTGYGLSKLVSEQICYHISKTKSLPVKVFRVGELSGDQSLGQWSVKEFLPLLIRTIVKLKSYPDLSSKSITWVPIDLAAKSLADLGKLPVQGSELHTIVSPQKSDWKMVIDYIQTQLNIELQKTSVAQFLVLLKSKTSSNLEETDIAQGLAEFLQDYLEEGGDCKISWDVKKTCNLTDYLNNCPKIDNDLISKYFNNWSSIGYFS